MSLNCLGTTELKFMPLQHVFAIAVHILPKLHRVLRPFWPFNCECSLFNNQNISDNYRNIL